MQNGQKQRGKDKRTVESECGARPTGMNEVSKAGAERTAFSCNGSLRVLSSVLWAET